MAVWGRSSWKLVVDQQDYSGQFYSEYDTILHKLKGFVMVQMRVLN